MGRIAARREFRLRELATRPPSGKSRSRGERASKRPRGARGKFESKPTAAVVSAIAHAGAAIAISPHAISAAAMLTACVTIPAARFSAPATLAAEAAPAVAPAAECIASVLLRDFVSTEKKGGFAF